MERMTELLDAEFSALTEKEDAAIHRTSEAKESLLIELQQYEKQLLIEAKKTGFDGIDLAKHIEKHCLEYNANNTLMLSKQLQQANQRNGALLSAMIRLNEYGLNLLTGKQNKTTVYGSSGHIESSVSTLTKLATA
jgi:flagellar biosynthesis/type III secretory pathway chaperone